MKDGTGLEDLLRDAAPQVLAALLRRFRDFDAAEDAVQEALLAAATQWPVDWPPRLAACLADSGRLPSSHRSHPHRDGAATAAGRPSCRRRRPRNRRRRTIATGRSRRHARAAVHVLSPRALAGIGDGAHAARGRRPHHRRDRRRVHGAGSDDGAAHQPGEAVDQDLRRAVPSCRRTAEWPSGSRPCMHVLYLIFNEGYASSSGRRSCEPTCRATPSA